MCTLKIQFKPMALLCLICLASFFLGSSRPDEDGRQYVVALNHSLEENTAEKEFDFIACWSVLLSQIDSLAELIIIERKVSVSEAEGDSIPGDIIYLASGLFQESLCIENSDFRIMGFPARDGERVVMITPGEIVTRITHNCLGNEDEVTEICLEHFNKKSFRICPGAKKHDTTGTAQFNMVRRELPGGVVQFSCELSDFSQLSDQIQIRRVRPGSE